MNVQKYINIFNRYKKKDTIIRVLIILFCILLFIGGMVGIIYSAINDNFDYFSLYCVTAFILPFIIFVAYIIWAYIYRPKKYDNYRMDIYNSNLTADDIMQIENEVGIDLFSIALKKRCLLELKMDRIPEWCVRDGVLPEKE